MTSTTASSTILSASEIFKMELMSDDNNAAIQSSQLSEEDAVMVVEIEEESEHDELNTTTTTTAGDNETTQQREERFNHLWETMQEIKNDIDNMDNDNNYNNDNSSIPSFSDENQNQDNESIENTNNTNFAWKSEEEKWKEIIECLDDTSRNDINLWRLRELALSKGGLLHPTIRTRAWPLLIAAFEREPTPMSSGNVSSQDVQAFRQDTQDKDRWEINFLSKIILTLLKTTPRAAIHTFGCRSCGSCNNNNNENHHNRIAASATMLPNNDSSYASTGEFRYHYYAGLAELVTVLHLNLDNHDNNSSTWMETGEIPVQNTIRVLQRLSEYHLYDALRVTVPQQERNRKIVSSSSSPSSIASCSNCGMVFPDSPSSTTSSQDDSNATITSTLCRSFLTTATPLQKAVLLTFLPLLETINRNAYQDLILLCRKYHPGDDLLTGIHTVAEVLSFYASTWFATATQKSPLTTLDDATVVGDGSSLAKGNNNNNNNNNNKNSNQHHRPRHPSSKLTKQQRDKITSRLADFFLVSHPLMPVYFGVAMLAVQNLRRRFHEHYCRMNDTTMPEYTDLASELHSMFQVSSLVVLGLESDSCYLAVSEAVEEVIEDSISYIKHLPPHSLVAIAVSTKNPRAEKWVAKNLQQITLLSDAEPPEWATADTIQSRNLPNRGLLLSSSSSPSTTTSDNDMQMYPLAIDACGSFNVSFENEHKNDLPVRRMETKSGDCTESSMKAKRRIGGRVLLVCAPFCLGIVFSFVLFFLAKPAYFDREHAVNTIFDKVISKIQHGQSEDESNYHPPNLQMPANTHESDVAHDVLPLESKVTDPTANAPPKQELSAMHMILDAEESNERNEKILLSADNTSAENIVVEAISASVISNDAQKGAEHDSTHDEHSSRMPNVNASEVESVPTSLGVKTRFPAADDSSSWQDQKTTDKAFSSEENSEMVNETHQLADYTPKESLENSFRDSNESEDAVSLGSQEARANAEQSTHFKTANDSQNESDPISEDLNAHYVGSEFDMITNTPESETNIPSAFQTREEHLQKLSTHKSGRRKNFASRGSSELSSEWKPNPIHNTLNTMIGFQESFYGFFNEGVRSVSSFIRCRKTSGLFDKKMACESTEHGLVKVFLANVFFFLVFQLNFLL